jgi:hypothetical protein
MALSEAQRRALAEIQSINERGRTAHVGELSCNRGVLARIEQSGFIHSERPFAGGYHSVSITSAGRAALGAGDE